MGMAINVIIIEESSKTNSPLIFLCLLICNSSFQFLLAILSVAQAFFALPILANLLNSFFLQRND